MVRLCLATVAVAVGLGLVCGCGSWSQCSLLQRFRSRSATECSDGAVLPEGAGPMVEGPPINGVGPAGPGITTIPPTPPQNTMPPLTPAPRIVPTPQAQPTPYTP